MDSQLNLYSLNKELIKQMKDPTSEEINELSKAIALWRYDNHINVGNFMLLNKEMGYYTIFRWQNRNDENFNDLVLECLNDVGTIKTWDIKNEAIEFWVIDKEESPICLYLFPYDNGIVYFGG